MTLPRRVSKPGPILDYLTGMLQRGGQSEQKARDAIDAIKAVSKTRDGAILLDLLEKATVDFFLDFSADPRALDALNAQRFIALDLRRIVSDEIDTVLEQIDAQRAGQSGGRGVGSRTRGPRDA